MTPTVPRYRVVRFKCHAKGENNQVRVCTNTTCRKQGSAQIVRHLKELVDPAQVSVETSGCLANCGSGPNVAFLPSGLVVKHVTTAAHVCSLVERQCVGGQSASLVLKALELRMQGNAAIQRSDLQVALNFYSAALELQAPRGAEMLYSNRSSVHLSLGHTQLALSDADEAIAAAPKWAKGYLRRADALEAIGDVEYAMVALHKALDLDSTLAASKSFCQQLKRVCESSSRSSAF
eukprot:CAMPEP_0114245836 /NCGR_PEP_ID=MMETSP0058-20121206/12124_1 /TAXON_ID=36894 /ORGANISM="Pyramimonas parkeae, CCMP726" /LENGTH=234 /DNA_ID=CAMNT_0001358947 /DNA_START=402 /DNA_END=1106 /DNA_ORIENTATION=+